MDKDYNYIKTILNTPVRRYRGICVDYSMNTSGRAPPRSHTAIGLKQRSHTGVPSPVNKACPNERFTLKARIKSTRIRDESPAVVNNHPQHIYAELARITITTVGDARFHKDNIVHFCRRGTLSKEYVEILKGKTINVS